MKRGIKEYLKLIRIYQWHKNAFVLIGFFALGEYGNLALFFRAFINTFAFCLISSFVYIFNDYCDAEVDRLHPVKKSRPLAAGTIQVKNAFGIGIIFLFLSLLLSFYNGLSSSLIIAGYLGNNLLYSVWLKRYPVIDVILIAFGFMLRILAGTIGIGIFISGWLMITGFLVSLLFGFSKRFSEISNYPLVHNPRKVLKKYTPKILKVMVIALSVATIITYSLYTVSPRALRLHGSKSLVYTIPIVILGIFRFLDLVVTRQNEEDPADFLWKDKILLLTLIFWIIAYYMIISGNLGNLL